MFLMVIIMMCYPYCTFIALFGQIALKQAIMGYLKYRLFQPAPLQLAQEVSKVAVSSATAAAAQAKDLLPKLQIPVPQKVQAGGESRYYHKYLKYKTKYLHLKNRH